MKKKKITLEFVLSEMRSGFKKVEKDTDQKIEDLATIVKNGFDRVDVRFEKVDARFEEIDRKFEKVDRRFDKIENSFGNRIDQYADDIRLLKTKAGIR